MLNGQCIRIIRIENNVGSKVKRKRKQYSDEIQKLFQYPSMFLHSVSREGG